jgi:integrase
MQWDWEVAVDFAERLQRRGLKAISVRSAASRAFRLVECLRTLDPAAVGPNFCVPSARLPQVENRYRAENGLTPAVLEKMLGACLLEIRDTAAVTGLRDLTPFAVYIAVRTGMNAGSLYALERDCLIPAGDDFMLVWNKPRAGGELGQRHGAKPWGVVDIIRRLQGLTNGPRLFSLPDRPIIDSLEPGLSEFRLAHGFPQFAMADLRPAAATWLYEISGGSVSRVQLFLGHGSMDTTLRYLHEWAVRPMQAKAVASAHAGMCARWGMPREDAA